MRSAAHVLPFVERDQSTDGAHGLRDRVGQDSTHGLLVWIEDAVLLEPLQMECPEDDAARYNGLWSVYPYFPSRTVIGCDIEKGLFVWTVDADVTPVPSLTPSATHGLIGLLLLVAAVATRHERFRRSPST